MNTSAIAPRRPVLRYHGAKFRLAPWIIKFFPAHSTYVEAFAGAAGVLMRKTRAEAEVLNDLDDRIVRVFRVLRDPILALELQRRLELTPFSRSEFEDAYRPPPNDDDEVEAVRRTIVLSFMGFGSDTIGRGYRTGFKCQGGGRGRNFPSVSWANYPEQIPVFCERLRAVVLENDDACKVMLRVDSPTTLHYVDPPYLYNTRASSYGRHGYRFEFPDHEHQRLAKVLHSLKGMVVLSGYPSTLYEDFFGDWFRHEKQTIAERACPRTEVLWLNPACAAALEAPQPGGPACAG